MNEIYFTKNDIWRGVGILMIIAGQFTPRQEYRIFDHSIYASELSIVGIAIAVVVPLLMRKWGNNDHK